MLRPLPRTTIADRIARIETRPALWLGLFAAALAVQIRGEWLPTPDASSYWSIARSIADGGGPRHFGDEHLWFPVGYPLLLAPCFLAGERPFLLFELHQWALAVVLMIGAHRWFRRRCPDAAVLLTGFCVLSLGFAVHFRRTLSEIAFLAAAIWGIERLTAAIEDRSRGRLARGTAGVFLLAFASLIRYAGVTFAVGMAARVLWDAWRAGRGWGRAIAVSIAIVVPSFAVVAGSVLREQAAAGRVQGRTYLDNLRDTNSSVLLGLARGVWLRTSGVGQVVLPGMFKAPMRATDPFPINILLHVSATILVGVGWLAFARRTRDGFALALPAYIAMHILYSYDDGARFMVPLLPLLAASVWEVLSRWAEIGRCVLAGAVAGHLAATLVHDQVIDRPLARAASAEWEPLERLARLAREEPAEVRLVSDSTDARAILQLLLERKCFEQSPDAPVDPVIGWVLTRDPGLSMEGFEERARAGGHYLLGRAK